MLESGHLTEDIRGIKLSNKATVNSLLALVIIDFIINTFVDHGTFTDVVNVISLIIAIFIVTANLISRNRRNNR